MTPAPDISIVIPTYSRRDSLARALRALAQQSLPADRYEVIIVIDGSQDGTREMVAGFQAPYALASRWQPNRGRAAAINAGVQMARGALLILLDDDMEPAREFVAAHGQAHAADVRAGIMGAAPIALPAGLPPLVADYVGPKFNRHLERLARGDQLLSLRSFYSGNFSVRRDVLLEVGGFDEAFQMYGNEDLELSIRLARAGVRLGYGAGALAYQHYSKDLSALARDTLSKGQTAVLLASKHPEAWPDLQLSTYAQASLAWRALRAGLLGLTRLAPGLPAAVVAVTRRLEPVSAGRALRYRLALDYCYWVGADAAVRANRRVGRGLRSLAGLARS